MPCHVLVGRRQKSASERERERERERSAQGVDTATGSMAFFLSSAKLQTGDHGYIKIACYSCHTPSHSQAAPTSLSPSPSLSLCRSRGCQSVYRGHVRHGKRRQQGRAWPVRQAGEQAPLQDALQGGGGAARRAVVPGVLLRGLGGRGAVPVGVAAGHAQERLALRGRAPAAHPAAVLLRRGPGRRRRPLQEAPPGAHRRHPPQDRPPTEARPDGAVLFLVLLLLLVFVELEHVVDVARVQRAVVASRGGFPRPPPRVLRRRRRGRGGRATVLLDGPRLLREGGGQGVRRRGGRQERAGHGRQRQARPPSHRSIERGFVIWLKLRVCFAFCCSMCSVLSVVT
jgi:hypothetical protein